MAAMMRGAELSQKQEEDKKREEAIEKSCSERSHVNGRRKAKEKTKGCIPNRLQAK